MKIKLQLIACTLLFIVLHQSLHAQTSWQLTGNAGTNTSVNFIGTTDSKPLVLRTKNIARMRITSDGNVGIGLASPLQKLHINGSINVDSSFGYYINNIRLLHTSGLTTFAADQTNFFAGQYAGSSVTDGFWNAALGYNALFSNTTGGSNTACGYNALYSNTTGGGNTATGTDVLHNNTEGFDNTASGILALFYNTTGYLNTAFGYSALKNNTEGQHNTAAGSYALQTNTTGDHNTAVGYLADADNGNYHNSSAFGYQALITASNQVRIGNSAVSSIGGYVNWSNISDGRFKKNVKDNVPGLAFIKALKPVTYNLDITGLENYQRKDISEQNDKIKQQKTDAEKQTIAEKEKIIYTGFVAQDVEKTAKQIGYDFSGVDAPKNSKDVYGLRYADFVVPLVKAVQELSKTNEENNVKIAALQKQNEFLQKEIDELKETVFSRSVFDQSTVNAQLSSASLEQNKPNPFYKTTAIGYTLPKNAVTALLNITDINGKTIKQISLNKTGAGLININAQLLNAGIYNYTLIVDGKAIETKKMVIAR